MKFRLAAQIKGSSKVTPFPCFVIECSVPLDRRGFEKKGKVSYDKVYKKLLTQQLILRLIPIIIIIIMINSINPSGLGVVLLDIYVLPKIIFDHERNVEEGTLQTEGLINFST